LGVTTVVAKLLNIVKPDRAYFGQKDAQQLAVVRRMVQDLNMPTEIVGCPIVREPDGLAMSSRNVYLSAEERAAATVLHQSLLAAERATEQGETSSDTIVEGIKRAVQGEPLAALEYAEVRSMPDFSRVDIIKGETLVAVAARIGKTRLIDNVVVSR
jgi:pantoate--beta-alanine ligase